MDFDREDAVLALVRAARGNAEVERAIDRLAHIMDGREPGWWQNRVAVARAGR